MAVSCQWVGGYGDFDEAPPPPPHPCTPLPLQKLDDAGRSIMSRVDYPGSGTASPCGWIDRTEVTVERYRQWLQATDPKTWDPTSCGWKREASDPENNSALCQPALWPNEQKSFDPDKPIRCIDWCDAEAFCRFEGKRLCTDNDSHGTFGVKDEVREWRVACTNGFTTVFPWGNDPARGGCNIGQTLDNCTGTQIYCGPFPVDNNPGCVNQRGVLDLIGNVAEWVEPCYPGDAGSGPVPCLTLGGGYDGANLGCGNQVPFPNDSRQPNVGFRCCASLTTEEQALITPVH